MASLTTPLAIGRSLVSGEHAVPLISHYRAFTRALVLVAADCFAIGLAGFAMAGAFLAYPVEYAKLQIVTIEIPVTRSIAATLALLVAGPPERAPHR